MFRVRSNCRIREPSVELIPPPVDNKTATESRKRAMRRQQQGFANFTRPSPASPVVVYRGEDKKFQCPLCPNKYTVASSLQASFYRLYAFITDGIHQKHAKDHRNGPSASDVASAAAAAAFGIGGKEASRSPNLSRLSPQASVTASPTVKLDAPDPGADASLRAPLPDDNTVILHATYNLPSLSIAINTILKCVICTVCSASIDPQTIRSHAKTHNAYHGASEAIEADLTREYGLVSPAHIVYLPRPIPPVYGVAVLSQKLLFCGECHHGFTHINSLNGHRVRCTGRGSYSAYGQRVTKGPHKRYFPVDASALCGAPCGAVDYQRVFQKTLPPPVNYSKEAIMSAGDEQNLDSFIFRERWLDAVKGYLPEDIVDSTRLPDADTEPWGKVLQQAAHRSVARLQDHIDQTGAFGLTMLVAQVFSE